MNKQAQLNEIYNGGVDWAFDHFYKLAEDDEVKITKEDVDKVASDRAIRAQEARDESVKIGTVIEVANNAFTLLNEAGHTEAAELISKTAQEDLSNVMLPSAVPEIEEGSEEAVAAEAAPSDEEAAEAAVQGAAEVIAELTGGEPEDPEIQEAAVEIVEEAVEAVSAAEAGAVTE